MEDREAYRRAKKRVEARLGFYIHLGVYVVVNIVLVIGNMTTSPEYYWFKWPMLGWGIGVAFHGLGVFVLSGKSAFKERWIEKEMNKEEPERR